MNDLKHKTIREGISHAGTPFFIYRIQGGVWCRHYGDNQYYITIPLSVSQAIAKEVQRIFAGKPYLQKSLSHIETEAFVKEGKTYENVTIGAKAYDENKEQLGENAFLQDVAIRFSEFTHQGKQGVAKAILQFVKSERSSTNYLGEDGYFADMQGTQAATSEKESLLEAPMGDDLPF